MINREDLAKIHIGIRELQGPLGPLTLDLFGDVGLRIRRVSYLYTINALKLHMWLVQYIRPQVMEVQPYTTTFIHS